MALPAFLSALEFVADAAEFIAPASEIVTKFTNNPSPHSEEIDSPDSSTVIPTDEPADTPSLTMTQRSSDQKSGSWRNEYRTPAIIGKQAIAYDPSQRAPAPSFLGHRHTTLLPFSFKVGSLTVPPGAEWDQQLTLATSIKAIEGLKKLIEPWRFAKFKSLEAICLPTYWIQYMNFQADAAWTTDAQPPFSTQDQMLEHLGHTRFVFAGGVTQSSNTIIPAPLGQLNSVIKDSASYVDTPRFNIILQGRKKDLQHDAVPIVDIVIRGVLEVGDISLY
uniref:Capsid protein n=1 Tax=Guarapuava tymovirus-like 2 TaxID=2487753 RepID=A0A3G4YJI3_9VIRU|nr:capsid protein [Guarapuava tymovirus-like 2]